MLIVLKMCSCSIHNDLFLGLQNNRHLQPPKYSISHQALSNNHFFVALPAFHMFRSIRRAKPKCHFFAFAVCNMKPLCCFVCFVVSIACHLLISLVVFIVVFHLVWLARNCFCFLLAAKLLTIFKLRMSLLKTLSPIRMALFHKHFIVSVYDYALYRYWCSSCSGSAFHVLLRSITYNHAMRLNQYTAAIDW